MPSALNIAGFNVRILGDTRSFNAALNSAQKALRRFDRQTARIGRGRTLFTGLGRAIRLVTAPLAAFGGLTLSIYGFSRALRNAVDETIRFENTLSRSISIIEDVNEKMRDEFRKTAISVSQLTEFTATEATKSFFFLASAGYDAQAAMKLTPEVAYFAQAGLIDLEESTSLLVDTMAAFGLKTDSVNQNLINMRRISNGLVKANIISNATVQELARSLQNKLAGTARAAGISFEETAASVTIFANQGIKGRVAGNRMNIVLRELQAKAISNAVAFRKLGLEVFEPLTGRLRPIADLLDEINALFETSASDLEGRRKFFAAGLTREAQDSLIQIKDRGEDVRKAFAAILVPESAKTIAERNLLPLVKEFNFFRAELFRIKLATRFWFDELTDLVKVLKLVSKGIADIIEDSRTFGEGFNRVVEFATPAFTRVGAIFRDALTGAFNTAISLIEKRLAQVFRKVSEQLSQEGFLAKPFELLFKAMADASAAAFIETEKRAPSDFKRARKGVDDLLLENLDPAMFKLQKNLENVSDATNEATAKTQLLTQELFNLGFPLEEAAAKAAAEVALEKVDAAKTAITTLEAYRKILDGTKAFGEELKFSFDLMYGTLFNAARFTFQHELDQMNVENERAINRLELETLLADELKLLELPPGESANERARLSANRKINEAAASFREGTLKAPEFAAIILEAGQDFAEAISNAEENIERQKLESAIRGSEELIRRRRAQGGELDKVLTEAEKQTKIQDNIKTIVKQAFDFFAIRRERLAFDVGQVGQVKLPGFGGGTP